MKIIQGDIIASNGLLHVIDTAMDKMAPTFESNTEVRYFRGKWYQPESIFLCFLASHMLVCTCPSFVLGPQPWGRWDNLSVFNGILDTSTEKGHAISVMNPLRATFDNSAQ